MNKYRKYFFGIVIILIDLACRKEVGDVNPDFIGDWKSSSVGGGFMKIISLDQSHGSYSKCERGAGTYYNCETISEGKATIKGDKLRIGARKFTIGQNPVYDAASLTWSVVLDNVKYFRSGDNPKGNTSSSPCENGVQDSTEFGVDCGGSCGKPCIGSIQYSLDNKYSLDTKYIYTGKNYVESNYSTIYNVLEPSYSLKLYLSPDSAAGNYPLDSLTYFTIAPPGGTPYLYSCKSGNYQIQKDTVRKSATVNFYFEAHCVTNGKTITINNGIISDWIYSKP